MRRHPPAIPWRDTVWGEVKGGLGTARSHYLRQLPYTCFTSAAVRRSARVPLPFRVELALARSDEHGMCHCCRRPVVNAAAGPRSHAGPAGLQEYEVFVALMLGVKRPSIHSTVNPIGAASIDNPRCGFLKGFRYSVWIAISTNSQYSCANLSIKQSPHCGYLRRR